MMKRRVVITGLGSINPLGHNIMETWQNAKEGKNGIDYIRRISTDEIDVKIAGEVKDFDFSEYLGRKPYRRLDRFTHLALKATDEAMDDSGLNPESLDLDRCGVYYSSGIGGLETIAEEEDKAKNKGYNRLSPFFIPKAIINLAAGNIAIKYGFKGMATASVTACASATNTIGDAFRAIRDGYLDVAISGGSEASITPLGLSGFKVMQALSKSEDPKIASRPFDKHRDGFVMGEGAGTIILEAYEHAKKRGANIHAELVGYGSTSDAFHITSPDSDGNGARKCMQQALKDGDVSLESVQHINAHGTSTPLNDKVESFAIRNLFQAHTDKIHVHSTKSMMGHLLGASGAVESVMTVLAVKNDFVPQTLNLTTPDPECDLNFTKNEGVRTVVDHALCNSFGFGGHNATLVFKKWRDENER